MSDTFRIVPYKVRSAGTDVPPEEIQTAINSLAQQTTVALNNVASDPTGPAGGDLSGTYPNPTVAAVHATSGTMSGVAITGGSIASTTLDASPVGATTPSTVAGTSLFAGGGAVPSVTATGTQIYNSPNPTIQFVDSIRSANNKNAYVQWGATVLAWGFANDAFTSFSNALTITGGQAAGISGITSTSGSGTWAHTGGFSASGGINSTTVGATTPSTGAFTTLTASSGLNGTAVGNTTPSTGAFTTLTASTPVGVASGGTGRNNLTSHGVLIGQGTANVNQTAAGTTGQVLVGATGADPAFGSTVGAITFTGAITPSTTSGIVGTALGDSANAGSVGEYVSNTATGTSLTSGTPTNAVSVSLTAGDWDVQGTAQFNLAGSTTSGARIAGISLVSNTRTTTLGNEFVEQVQAVTGGAQVDPTPVVRLNLSATTTVYLVVQCNFSVSTCTADGFIRARRIR